MQIQLRSWCEKPFPHFNRQKIRNVLTNGLSTQQYMGKHYTESTNQNVHWNTIWDKNGFHTVNDGKIELNLV